MEVEPSDISTKSSCFDDKTEADWDLQAEFYEILCDNANAVLALKRAVLIRSHPDLASWLLTRKEVADRADEYRAYLHPIDDAWNVWCQYRHQLFDYYEGTGTLGPSFGSGTVYLQYEM